MLDDILTRVKTTVMMYRTKLGCLGFDRSVLKQCLVLGGTFGFALLESSSVLAQINADDTVSTQVNRSDNVTEISGGTTSGNNLFHSFQEFSVEEGSTAFFNNAESIGNIISRVTGETASNIDGSIRANGNANLILLNPNGISFGANARLDLGGSFLGTTADSLIFEDGTEFSASASDTPPLLTVSVPVGLQLGQNSGAIDVTGEGHELSLATTVFSHLNRDNLTGLEIEPGRTLGLVGNGITLSGGILTAESGDIKLGSVVEGTIGIELSERGWNFDYENVSSFGNIDLTGQAAVDTSGNGNGAIELQGRQISLYDGSVVLSQNLGERGGGDIEIKATESLNLIGVEPEGIIASGLYSETIGTETAADIEVATRQLAIADGASIISTTSSSAEGGDVTIEAADFLRFVGFSSLNPNIFSVVSVQTFGSGKAGDVNVSTKNFAALDGANISSVTGSPQGTGTGGNIKVKASEAIELIGANAVTFAPSQITAGSGGPGNAGNVEIITSRLAVRDGGRVDASATASGNAGNIKIVATESLEVRGTFPGSINPSLITASANILDPALRSLFGLPDIPTGNSGSIVLDTPRLDVVEEGQVTVRNDGTGDAGDLIITANSVELNSEGGLTAAVRQGDGGKITVNATESIALRNGSQIANDNSGAGDSGEVILTANSLEIADGAFISTATSSSGGGGDIILDIAEATVFRGTGYGQFQQDFQLGALDGSLQPGTRGTGIFLGTAGSGRSGNLSLNTGSLRLEEGAIISSPIFTDGTGGNIEIAAEAIEVVGSAIQITAGIDSSSAGAAGDIKIATGDLILDGGGTIVNATFGDAAGGAIELDATGTISLTDTPTGSFIFTGIYANTGRGNGDSGGILLTADNLYLNDSLISSNTGVFIQDGSVAFAGGGTGGDIVLDIANSIEISGIPTNPLFVTGISSGSFAEGSAGNIKIAAEKLSLRDGLEISTTATASGNGGNITIDAESIELFGTFTSEGMTRGGLIAASSTEVFGQPQNSGSSGNIQITTDNLSIQNGASIDVQSFGTGRAGNLSIEARDDIVLDNRGTISAATNSGTGGNISLQADNIFWLGGSTTTATARGNADGGNIDLQADNLVALEASRLTAEANAGRGGNINVNTRGLFICEECLVSASSRLGIDGIINITTLNPNPELEVIDVPIELTQPEEAVVLACSATANNPSSLTIGGRGGLAPRPTEMATSKAIAEFAASSDEISTEETQLPPPARNWYVNERGTVVLTARSAGSTPQFNSPDCDVP